MSTVFLNGDKLDKKSVENAAGVTDRQVDLSFVASSYQFKEPKETFASVLFPSDETWHPLCNHTYKEITTHIVGIESMGGSNEDKKKLLDRVKEIVIESYPRRSKSVVYQGLLCVAIVILIQVLFGIKGNTFLYYFYGISAFIIVANLMYANIWAQGAGESYWATYWSDFSSRAAAGTATNKILEQYTAEEERDKDRAIMSMVNTAAQYARYR